MERATSGLGKMRVVIDVDAEPDPLRSELQALVASLDGRAEQSGLASRQPADPDWGGALRG